MGDMRAGVDKQHGDEKRVCSIIVLVAKLQSTCPAVSHRL